MDDYTTKNYDDNGNRFDDTGRSLYYLHELSDYKVDSEYSDVRGWKVHDKDGRHIGKVNDLVVNRNTEQVVYLAVELDKDLLAEGRRIKELSNKNDVQSFVNEEGEDHILLPIGTAVIDKEDKKVFTEELGYSHFLRNKWIRGGSTINREHEYASFRFFFPGVNIDRNIRDDRFYDRREFFKRRRT